MLDSGWTTCFVPSSEDKENMESKLNDGILGILEKMTQEVNRSHLQNINT